MRYKERWLTMVRDLETLYGKLATRRVQKGGVEYKFGSGSGNWEIIQALVSDWAKENSIVLKASSKIRGRLRELDEKLTKLEVEALRRDLFEVEQDEEILEQVNAAFRSHHTQPSRDMAAPTDPHALTAWEEKADLGEATSVEDAAKKVLARTHAWVYHDNLFRLVPYEPLPSGAQEFRYEDDPFGAGMIPPRKIQIRQYRRVATPTKVFWEKVDGPKVVQVDFTPVQSKVVASIEGNVTVDPETLEPMRKDEVAEETR
jgi:hypothetical protein